MNITRDASFARLAGIACRLRQNKPLVAADVPDACRKTVCRDIAFLRRRGWRITYDRAGHSYVPHARQAGTARPCWPELAPVGTRCRRGFLSAYHGQRDVFI